MVKIRAGVNEYGTPVSIHICDSCGNSYTLCPPAEVFGNNCLALECPSYDVSRDADLMFAIEPGRIRG